MIVDRIENWRRYFDGPGWRLAFEFLEKVSAESEEIEIELDGRNVFTRVMSYPTQGPEGAKLEAHRTYVDIQMALVESEGIDWFPRDSLDLKTPYNEEKDVEYYHRPGPAPARVNVFPGTFVALFPEDAHMPKQITGDSSVTVKKVVAKVRLDQVGIRK
jgi:YhcH/YjgK/YiaL family protein